MSDSIYISLKDNIDAFWPHQFIPAPPLDVLENVWLEPMRIIIEPTKKLCTAVLLTQSVELPIPGFEQIGIVFGADDQDTVFLAEVDLEPIVGRLTLPIAIRFHDGLLKPVSTVTNSEGKQEFQIDSEAQHLDMTVADATVSLDQQGTISIESDVNISLPLCSVGDTGLILQAENILFDLSREGLRINLGEVFVQLPEDLPLPPGTRITMTDARIDPSGFSGEVRLDLNLEYIEATHEYVIASDNPSIQPWKATIFGDLAGGLRRVQIAVEQNRLARFEIAGSMVVPYFNEPVDIRVNLAANGAFSVTLLGGDADGVTISRQDLLALNLRSLSVSKDENNVGQLVVSGGLEPRLMSSNGMQWPKLDVTDLSIDSNGKFSIKEAWMDLKDLATLDLFGFHFELRRIGLGSQAATDANGERLWIDLSGGLRLIEQIPVGLDVEGFRLTWPQNLLDGISEPDFEQIKEAVEKINVEFDGINLSFGIPDTVEFEGLIRFFKQPTLVGFAGDVALRVPAAGFAAEAGLMVGLSFDPVYPFLYVYFGVELPAGIPLGQSGLALKGALGMFGLNVVPDKEPDQNWYYDWYKRGPIVGAHPTNKWKPQQNALALGVGVTITTADGYVKGTRGLLVLSLPGPFLMIEGRALLLSGLNPTGEPPLRALAIFDGGAGTVQFNIEAEATLIEGLFKAYGMLEAFFDFNDLTNWHIYLGQDTPRDRRIRADLIKLEGSFLFNADAYLMIDMVGAGTLRSRMGASIAFEPHVDDVGPAKVDFKATIEGDGMMTARPEQFSGKLDLSAHLELTAFEQTIRLSADAEFLTEGPEPLTVGAEVNIRAEPPAPFDPIEATFEFDWQSDPAPKLESPLAEIDITSRFVPACVMRPEDPHKATFTIQPPPPPEGEGPSQDRWKSLAEDSPIVDLDAKPIIGFKQKMNSALGAAFARHPNGVRHHYHAGAFEFTPTLKRIELYQHIKIEGEEWDGTTWGNPIASTDDPDKPLPGVWLAEFDPQSSEEPSPRRIQLWTDNPLTASARAFGGSAGQIITSFSTVMGCVYTSPDQVCVDFESAENVVIEPREVWDHEDLRFESSGWAKVREEAEVISNTILSRLIAFLVRIIAFLLRLLVRALKNWFPKWRLVRRIIGCIERLEAYHTKLIRNPPSTPHHCLVVGGDLNILFGRRVREVHIFLCREPKKKYSTEEQPGLIANRAVRSVEDLAEARRELGRDPTLDEIRACNNPVAFDFSMPEKEWVLRSETGFDCLHLTKIGGFSIRKICYRTLEEYERSRRAQEECDDNTQTLPQNPPALASDAYYRLDITTEVTGRVDSRLLPEGFIGELAGTAYGLFLEYLKDNSNLGKEITARCFFKTDGPPTNLQPYVKWCYPAHQAERFFYGHDITIRFLRSNLETMYAPPNYDIQIQITDAQGKLVPNFNTSWQDARTGTQFSEESLWETRRRDLNWPVRTVPPDNMLVARIPTASDSGGLSPSARYQLQVVRSADVLSPFVPVEKSKVLFSSSFVTSAFSSFGAMVKDHTDRSVDVKADYQEALAALKQASFDSSRLMARQRLSWEHAQVEYRLKELKNSKQGLEAAKLAAREANAVHDENFRSLAMGIADLYFAPLAEKLEVWAVLDRKLNHLVCVWVRSPESLDVRLPVYGDTEATLNTTVDYVGRTEIQLRLRNQFDSGPILDLESLSTADGMQALLFPTEGTWTPGIYDLILTYHRNYEDEQRAIDHRYDRPVEYSNGSVASPPSELRCGWL